MASNAEAVSMLTLQARATALTVGVLQRSDLALLLLDGRCAGSELGITCMCSVSEQGCKQGQDKAAAEQGVSDLLAVASNRAGIGTEDSALADWLRRTVDTPVVLAANKCERRGGGVSGATH